MWLLVSSSQVQVRGVQVATVFSKRTNERTEVIALSSDVRTIFKMKSSLAYPCEEPLVSISYVKHSLVIGFVHHH